MLTQTEISSTIKQLKKMPFLSNFRIGYAGSYALGTQSSDSDLDIVVSTDSLTINQIETIKAAFNQDVDVLQLDLLRKDDESLDNFSRDMGLPINENSVYKTISKEVIWV